MNHRCYCHGFWDCGNECDCSECQPELEGGPPEDELEYLPTTPGPRWSLTWDQGGELVAIPDNDAAAELARTQALESWPVEQ